MTSYPKIYNVGHPCLDGFFDGEVEVEEKVDGSQFSFHLADDGTVRFRSKRADIFPESAGMFGNGIQYVLSIVDRLTPGVTYRGEYLQRPNHNVLVYDRVPVGHIILFDAMTDAERYMTRAELEQEAEKLGLEIVPLLFTGKLAGPADVEQLLERTSVLGGPRIEGLVFKRRTDPIWGRDGKSLLAKYVSTAFREVHKAKKYKVPKKDIVEAITEQFRTEARWQKAVQHLAEAGELERSPRDIGKLIAEAQRDLTEECSEQIKALLFASFSKQIVRGSTIGLPDWYKAQLLERQFNSEE